MLGIDRTVYTNPAYLQLPRRDIVDPAYLRRIIVFHVLQAKYRKHSQKLIGCHGGHGGRTTFPGTMKQFGTIAISEQTAANDHILHCIKRTPAYTYPYAVARAMNGSGSVQVCSF